MDDVTYEQLCHLHCLETNVKVNHSLSLSLSLS